MYVGTEDKLLNTGVDDTFLDVLDNDILSNENDDILPNLLLADKILLKHEPTVYIYPFEHQIEDLKLLRKPAVKGLDFV